MIDFIERFGSALIFVVLFLDQLGVPIPATPIVLALGALAARGAIEPLSSLAVATAGSLCASLLGFQLGRRIGARVLGLFCRISLEPDTCVSMTKDTFSRHGAKALLVAKFLPGVDILAPPLAGMLGIGKLPFVLCRALAPSSGWSRSEDWDTSSAAASKSFPRSWSGWAARWA